MTKEPSPAHQYYPKIIKERAVKMRNAPTKPEFVFWQMIRNSKTGHKFRRQQQIGGQYIVDFICFEKKLIVEIDGGFHNLNMESDTIRTKFLEECGFKIFRFWSNDVMNNQEGCYLELMAVLGEV